MPRDDKADAALSAIPKAAKSASSEDTNRAIPPIRAVEAAWNDKLEGAREPASQLNSRRRMPRGDKVIAREPASQLNSQRRMPRGDKVIAREPANRLNSRRRMPRGETG